MLILRTTMEILRVNPTANRTVTTIMFTNLTRLPFAIQTLAYGEHLGATKVQASQTVMIPILFDKRRASAAIAIRDYNVRSGKLAEKGNTTVILRHSRPAAAVVPASQLEAFNVFRRVMNEVGETLELSRDPAILDAVKRAHEDISKGNIVWDDEG